MSQLATIPHAPITVTNLATGESTPREPGSRFGLGAVTGVRTEGPSLIVTLGRYEWTFACADVAAAEKYAVAFAIRAGR